MHNVELSVELIISLGTIVVTVTATFFAVRGQVGDLKTRVDYIEKHQEEKLSQFEKKQDLIDRKLDDLKEGMIEIRGFLANVIPPFRKHRHGEN